MDRRRFLSRCGAAALAVPFAAPGQGKSLPTVGLLNSEGADERVYLAEAFRQGLKEGGYVVGENVLIEYRWAEGSYGRLPEMAAELVNRQVVVIVATGSVQSAAAAKAATSTIPVLFAGTQDQIKGRIQVMSELVPRAAVMALLLSPKNRAAAESIREAGAAAGAAARVQAFNAGSEREIDDAFGAMKQARANVLVVAADSFLVAHRRQIITLAARHALPASYPFREFATDGGLMSYGPDARHHYRLTGAYIARVLKGEKPADLPALQPTKFELCLNMRTARKLGLGVSPDFLKRVDHVIE